MKRRNIFGIGCLSLFGLMFACGVIMALIPDKTVKEVKEEENKEIIEEIEQKIPEVKEWVEVVTFSTDNKAQTDTFILEGGKQRLTYKGDCTIYVLEEGIDLMEDGGVPTIMMSEEDGETFIRKSAGEYYMEVWAITGTCELILEEERAAI